MASSDDDDEFSILNIFDPFRQSISSPESVEILPDQPVDQNSFSVPPLFPHSIQIRLKLSTCSEIKPFYQLVQRIRDQCQSKEVDLFFFLLLSIIFSKFPDT